eukprot:35004_1
MHSYLVKLYLLSISLYGNALEQWISFNNPLIPRADDQIAVGCVDGLFHLLGGRFRRHQIALLDIASTAIIAENASALPIEIYGKGDYYTQIQHHLYVLETSGRNINVYDMMTNIFFANYWIVPGEGSLGSSACLTSTNKHLFVIGG